ncbi:TPA: TetR/AcrR family transcriptional regulator, partial [Streptococcus pyogenes]
MTDKALSKRSLQNLTQFNKETRRIARESMEIALLNLLKTKPLGDITISELVTKAGVSRNAFYRNYTSKEAIIEQLLVGVIRRIFRGLKQF